MSWDNAALISLDTMQALKIEENEAIEIELDGRKVIAPVLACAWSSERRGDGVPGLWAQ